MMLVLAEVGKNIRGVASMDKAFMSEIDKFLQELAEKYPKPSATQEKEQQKYKRLNYLRDHLERKEKERAVWDE